VFSSFLFDTWQIFRSSRIAQCVCDHAFCDVSEIVARDGMPASSTETLARFIAEGFSKVVGRPISPTVHRSIVSRIARQSYSYIILNIDTGDDVFGFATAVSRDDWHRIIESAIHSRLHLTEANTH
jgi:hypothetical protein